MRGCFRRLQSRDFGVERREHVGRGFPPGTRTAAQRPNRFRSRQSRRFSRPRMPWPRENRFDRFRLFRVVPICPRCSYRAGFGYQTRGRDRPPTESLLGEIRISAAQAHRDTPDSRASIRRPDQRERHRDQDSQNEKLQIEGLLPSDPAPGRSRPISARVRCRLALSLKFSPKTQTRSNARSRRITPQLSGRATPCPAAPCHGPLQLLVRRHRCADH